MLHKLRLNNGPLKSPLSADNIIIFCFSHLRWDFVFQRPQHLMSRFAQVGGVVYWEEPIFERNLRVPELKVRAAVDSANIIVVTPRLPERLPTDRRDAALASLLEAFAACVPGPIVKWYYTPMLLPFSRHLEARATVYDCMDELSAFRFAPPELIELEEELLHEADLVFTGGYSLFEAKRHRHSNIHAFPSAVDKAHFNAARATGNEPADQSAIPHPRFGFYGVIDERLDIDLLTGIADARPDWQLVMLGPVVKIEPHDLPRRQNIHYLGSKDYDELPAYLSGWDVALMPFALNESTRFISPTKTPEYLAGGRPVVSTRIRDVERHYARLDGVAIADGTDEFVRACERLLAINEWSPAWLAEADLLLADLSWDLTQARMHGLILEIFGERRSPTLAFDEAAVVAA